MKQKETSLPIGENSYFSKNTGYKTDSQLGKAVQKYLIVKKAETPVVQSTLDAGDDEKKIIIEKAFTTIMKTLGLNLADDSLKDTPSRIAKMYLSEVFYGLNFANFPKCTTVENKIEYSEMVIERNINVQSVCEHHFVSIDGVAHVSYIPKMKVIGLSKINRVVDFFSRRPQIQERLTEQIYFALSYILETEDIAVMIQATHFCVKSRGIQDVNSDTITSKLGGVFLDHQNHSRQEFLSLIRI